MSLKREEKKTQQRTELMKLEGVLVLRETSMDQFKSELQILEIENGKELEKQIKKLKIKLGVISKADMVAWTHGRRVTSTATSKYPIVSSHRNNSV